MRGTAAHAEEAGEASGGEPGAEGSVENASRVAPRGRRPAARGGLVAGALFGLSVAALILAVYVLGFRGSALLGNGPAGIRAKVDQLGMGTPALFVVLALFYSVAHSGLEEYYWRWFVFGGLRSRLTPGWAIVISSLAFTAHHVIVLGSYFGRASWITFAASLGVAIGGAVWAGIYERSGSLLGPWLSHLIVDAALMTVGYDMLWPVI
jgi:membrane protease YdiL (CAAX protease family)